MSYRYLNNNSKGNFQNDCTIRAIATATGESWDYVYDHMSEIAKESGVMMDYAPFIVDFLSSQFEMIPIDYQASVGEIADEFEDNIVLITMEGHITCSKYGIIYDSFDPRNRLAEYVWIVK